MPTLGFRHARRVCVVRDWVGHMRSDRKTALISRDTDLSSLDEEQALALLTGALRIDPRAGILKVLDTRFALLRPIVLVNIQRQLEQTVGASTKGFMYLAGERTAETGVDVAGSLVQDFEKDPLTLDSIGWLTNALALLGYGRFEVLRFDPVEKRIAIALSNSPFAEAYGSAPKPVCHLIAGFLAGLGRRLLAQELLCEEIACKSQGKARCEFELRPMLSL